MISETQQDGNEQRKQEIYPIATSLSLDMSAYIKQTSNKHIDPGMSYHVIVIRVILYALIIFMDASRSMSSLFFL
jgi:hypothetical protein